MVPVPELEPLVRARHAHYDPAYVSADPTFAHAHITVLAPFVGPDALPEVTPLIAQIVSRTMPFGFELTMVDTFPNGIIHLLPVPDEPFTRLTAALWRAFPAYPPYAGAFPDVRPHLTLDAVGPQVTEDVVRTWVAPLTPITGYADRVQFSWYEPGACQTVATWPLRGPGPGSVG